MSALTWRDGVQTRVSIEHQPTKQTHFSLSLRSIPRVCTRAAVDLSQSSTKVKIYYATAYRFFHPWPAASAINGKERERQKERKRERGGEWYQRAEYFVPQSLTH